MSGCFYSSALAVLAALAVTGSNACQFNTIVFKYQWKHLAKMCQADYPYPYNYGLMCCDPKGMPSVPGLHTIPRYYRCERWKWCPSIPEEWKDNTTSWGQDGITLFKKDGLAEKIKYEEFESQVCLLHGKDGSFNTTELVGFLKRFFCKKGRKSFADPDVDRSKRGRCIDSYPEGGRLI